MRILDILFKEFRNWTAKFEKNSTSDTSDFDSWFLKYDDFIRIARILQTHRLYLILFLKDILNSQ